MSPAKARSVSLFASASRRQRTWIARLADEIEVPAGTVLTTPGELARQFFVIESGTAEVTRDGVRVAVLGPGDFFGERGLLEGPRRTARVVATTPMRLLVLAPREFRTLMHGVPAVAGRIERALAGRR